MGEGASVTASKVRQDKIAPPPPPKPSIGRIVHYTTDPHGTTKAALIIDVFDDETVDLAVFNHTGVHPLDAVSFAEEPTPGFWSWPPRS